MKLTKTSLMVLGIGIIIIVAASMYMVYQGQVQKREEATNSLANARKAWQSLTDVKEDTDVELIQLENELAQGHNELSQLEAELAQTELTLNQTGARFPIAVESIEYDEVLFGFADGANLEITSLTASEPAELTTEDITIPTEVITVEDIAELTEVITIDGITYTTTFFTVSVRGEVADILDFINRVVADDDFQTAILEPITMNIPGPLTEAEKETIEETIRAELTAEAIAKLTTEDILGFIVEAIAEVTGQEIETLAVEEMAETIRVKIAESLESGDVALLPEDLAELIEEYIAGSIVALIVEPLAQEIADLIVAGGEDGFLEEDLVELLGEDIAELLGEEIAGSLPGNIASLLTEYIAKLVEEKMVGSVVDLVEESAVGLAAEKIEEAEKPSATITLMLYTYQGEGE